MSVLHPQYGLGTVKTISETTADILFTEGKRTVAPEAAGLEPADAQVAVSGLNVPLKLFVEQTLEAAVQKLGLEKPEPGRSLNERDGQLSGLCLPSLSMISTKNL